MKYFSNCSGLIAGLVGVCGLAASGVGQTYDITDLGGIAGPAQAYALNGSGMTAGAAIAEIDAGSPFRAFVWDGSFHAIDPLVGEEQSHALAIDSGGAAYGASFTIGKFRMAAFVSDMGPPVYLGEFAARGANDLGAVVGTTVATDGAGWRTTRACVFSGGALVTLPGLGGESASAMAIADNGDIAGLAALPDDRHVHATLWRSGVVHDLGTLGGQRSQAFAVNESGLIAGFADTAAGDPHAFLFQTDGAGNVVSRTDLGVLGENFSYAYGLDEAGQAVGTSDDRAFLWDGSRLIDLNGQIPAGTAWHLQAATAINEAGQITGWGRLLGVPRAFLLTPKCFADFNGDGTVDTRDFVAYLNAWATGDPSADIDGDGLVDTRDFIAYLNLWAAGC
jgi:probable HAF family extracellular repeat protein